MHRITILNETISLYHCTYTTYQYWTVHHQIIHQTRHCMTYKITGRDAFGCGSSVYQWISFVPENVLFAQH